MRWLVILTALFAFNTVSAADLNIAVVDMERALFMSDAAQAGVKEFEQNNKADIDKLKSLEKELTSAKERLDKEGDIMSADQRRTVSNDMQQKGQEYQFYVGKLKKQEDAWKREFLNKQLPEMEKILKKIIDEKGYDMVVNAQAVVFTSPKADITKLLIERLNSGK
ncbi:MAG TPA: hypothetical protein DEA26_00975 [Oceanospirillales bacterium]|nr:hypothetical protein [Oceanospirillaceae bacterium]HBS41222.1 hypothetical protein [Oceanospirillales bacterium]|tara:strand:+ start:1198 stop:1695 length:498 start_codon:yes stop_codon:yes gene_type:complete